MKYFLTLSLPLPLLVPLLMSLFVFQLFFEACSAVPRFRTSVPIESAHHSAEALDLCLEYRLPVAGAKVVDLVPWVNCFESAFRAFPDLQSDTGFVIFFRALKARHDLVVVPHDHIKDPLKMNQLVTHVVTAFKDTRFAFSDEDYWCASREFPRYAEYLELRGLFRGVQSRSEAVRTAMGPLADDLSEAVNGQVGKVGQAGKGLNQRPHAVKNLNSTQKEFCAQYRSYLSKLESLRELLEYQDILNQKADDTESEDRALLRLGERIRAMKPEALASRAQLRVDLNNLKKSDSHFSVSSCTQ